MENLRYPIGQFKKPSNITDEHIAEGIAEIASFPKRLQKEVSHLSNKQLDTPYRPKGWTIRQVVHHCADSHMNSFIRFKWALTEDSPLIKAYYEERWAELPDSKNLQIEPSLGLLKELHSRWAVLLSSLNQKALQRNFTHPANNELISLRENILIYAWHGNHHLAHITTLKKKNNW